MSKETWCDIFRDAAKELGFKSVELDENASCSIQSDRHGMPPIHIAFDEESDGIVIFAEVGFVLETDKELYQDLLFDNLFGHKTKGAVFAASRESGQIVLQRQLNLALIPDGKAFAAILVDFAEIAHNSVRRMFRSVLPPEEDRSSEGLAVPGIRV